MFFEDDEYIIVDKAYPLSNWVMTPYLRRGILSENQVAFNTCHSTNRVVIERSFALLLGRFRRLRQLDMKRLDLVPNVIVAACVLHNICLDFPDGCIDGSAAPAGCTSINSALEIWPKLHNDLLSVLLRFRTYAVSLMGDIEKVFCQIKIKDTHKDFLRFFWRDSISEELQVMRLLFLLFGLRCSPYIAIRCLIETAKSLELRYPRACALIQDSFYVDDFIAGADTLEDALSLIDELCVVCNSGGFNLRKWTSSDPNVIQRMQITGELKPHAFQDFDEDTKVLGLSCPVDTAILLQYYCNIVK